jgi:hypothetical protein
MAAWIPCNACGQVAVRVDPAEMPARVLCAGCTTNVTDQQHRRLAHLYAALRNHIEDELKYDRDEGACAPLDDDAYGALGERMYAALTALMVAAHAEEAAAIQAEIDAYWASVGWSPTTG